MGATLKDESDEDFIAALTGEDELGVIVRAHIHVEAMLIRFLELFVANPAALDAMDLTYEQRVHLAVAFGFKKQYAAPLKAFGKLRNSFAHKINFKLKDSDVNNLYKAFDGDDRQIIVRAFENTKKQVGSSFKGKFSEQDAKTRLVSMAVVLRNMFIAARRNIEAGVE